MDDDDNKDGDCVWLGLPNILCDQNDLLLFMKNG